MEMKLIAHHQKYFNFDTILVLVCNLTLIISYIPMDANCLAAINNEITQDPLGNNSRSSDRLTLIAFKNEITQDPLGTLSSWNNNSNSLHFCKWRGVTCSRRHPRRVTRLVLPSQRLIGTISSHIGNLSFLKDLSLSNNSLTGEVPDGIGRLFRLENLDISYNFLEGEIPENISYWSNLTNLEVSNNKLTGRIPNELGYLPNLKSLLLDNNNLSGEVPASLGNLSSLTHLGLQYNNLEGRIPKTLNQLRGLTILDMSSNRFSGLVPSSLYNVSSLEIFSVMSNQLHGSIPFDIGSKLPNLTFFSIANNNFMGTIPNSISNMSKLEVLQLQTNGLVGPVPYNFGNLRSLVILSLEGNNLGNGQANDLDFLNSLINCTNLEFLVAGYNTFGGVLPRSITNLTTKLQVLDFGKNEIYGNVPTGIHNLLGLTELSLNDNLFTGSIPTSIGNLQSLQKLNFGENKISGSIPSSFGSLTRLLQLGLYGNDLTGLIPSSLGNCDSLQVLDISTNRLSGSIPKQVFELPSLSVSINLGNNLFTGSVPVEVGNLNNLGELDLSKNKLSGEIPSSIGKCISLTYLNLEGNYFQGNIPPAITFLKGLESLSLSHNNLSGLIPKGLENLTTLNVLDLSFNNLEGDVPKYGVFKNISAIHIDGMSKLCGGIPDLKLSNCSVPLNPNKDQKQRKSMAVKAIVIGVVTVVLLSSLIGFFLTLYWRKNSPSKPSDVGNRSIGVSYSELLQATNGFNDSTNLLGVGSFGSVYKGVLRQDESKPVAVKVLHLQQRGATKSFVAECNALREVRHRNLLKIITCCSSTDFQGNPFKALVYEFMAKGSLENWLHPTTGDTNNNGQPQTRNLNLERRLSIALDVAFALNYLHHECQSPIVHCDVKPSNVLLDDDLTARVGDFGLAKFISNPSSNSQPLNEQNASSIAIKGSIGYVSPEYGMGGEVSTQGDVYIYGILLLEMFTGKRPTDDMFQDGLNIHTFAEMHALPERVLEIVDPCLLLESGDVHDGDEVINYNTLGNERRSMTRDAMRQTLASIIQIGVLCSSELPLDRINMSEVIVRIRRSSYG